MSNVSVFETAMAHPVRFRFVWRAMVLPDAVRATLASYRVRVALFTRAVANLNVATECGFELAVCHQKRG
jgi:hypothetical protein